MNELRHLDLFSGIGGFAEAARLSGGIRTIGFAEVEPYCCAGLAERWPGIPNLGDIHGITIESVDEAVSQCDVGDMGQPRNPKYDTARSLYESGLSIQECADYFQITRQAMWKILLRRGTEMREQLKHGEENHFDRGGQRWDGRAHNLVESAIKKGILVPKPCEVCGQSPTFKDGRSAVQAHHDDYNKPLDVRWLCQKHHHEWHKHNRPIPVGREGSTRNPTGIDIITGGFP